MTAQLLEYTSASDARVRRVRAARAASVGAPVAPHRGGRAVHAPWRSTEARACEVARPVSPTPARAVPTVTPSRLVWTPRGAAVLVILVALIAGVMLTTAVGAFLAVSNAPLVAVVGG